jgi:hypothetical protein
MVILDWSECQSFLFNMGLSFAVKPGLSALVFLVPRNLRYT